MDKIDRRKSHRITIFILLFCAFFTVRCTASSLPNTSTAIPTTPPPTDTPATQATPTPIPTLVPTVAPLPTIAYFRADVTEAAPGQTVTLEWASSGADTAIIQRILPSGQLAPTWIDVSATGTLSYQIPADDQNVSVLNLYVWQNGQQGATAAATLQLALSCQTEWFFEPAPETCPDALRSSNATEQQFEHGVMLWVEEFYWADPAAPTANNRTIYVFFDTPIPDAEFRVFTDEWTDAQPASDPQLVPPADRYQPLRGFGKIWRDNPDMQARLGWATGEEKDFVISMQADTATQYPHLYLQALDGSVRNLWSVNYSWEALP